MKGGPSTEMSTRRRERVGAAGLAPVCGSAPAVFFSVAILGGRLGHLGLPHSRPSLEGREHDYAPGAVGPAACPG